MLESLFKKVAGLEARKSIKERLQHRCFPVNIAKFLRTRILENICELMLLLGPHQASNMELSAKCFVINV